MAGAGVLFVAVLRETDAGHASPRVADVAGGAPAVAAHFRAPLPHVTHSVLAEAVYDVAVGFVEGPAHDRIRLLQFRQVLLVLVDVAAGVRAPVILQIIEAPLGVTLCVLGLVLVACRKPGTRGRAGRRINAGPQTLAVDVVAKGLHVGKLLVRVDHSVCVARLALQQRIVAPRLDLPAIVDVDVRPAVLRQPAVDHGVGGRAHFGVVDGDGKAVPTVPAQRRRQGDLVAADDFEFPLCFARAICRLQRDHALPSRPETSGNLTGRLVKLQIRWQAEHVEFHRSLTGGGNGIQERMERPHADNLRAVDPRRRRRLRRQHDLLFARGGNRHRLLAADLELRFGPVGMVVGDVVPLVLDDQNQRLHAGHVDVRFLGGVAFLHRAAFPKVAAVAVHREPDADRLAGHFVIDANRGGEAGRSTLQVHIKQAGRMGAKPVLILCAGDRQGVAVHRFVGLGLSPVLSGLTHVERRKPDAFCGESMAREGNGEGSGKGKDQTLTHDGTSG